MKKRYKIISEDFQKSLVEFLDEVQFDAAKNLSSKESMHVINFCNWAIKELLDSYDGYLKDDIKKKSRDDYVEETFMDWNLPDMSDEDYEKLVDQFDNFLRGWETEYNKKNPDSKIKKNLNHIRPDIEDVAEYMSLDEIKEYLLDDPDLTDEEAFELYYEEHEREKILKERKSSKSLNKMLKDLNIEPFKN